jgi:FlaA1/EpsC-like NDP-sugar epimerase
LAYSDKLPIKTARFANVAFSNGSLPLGFLARLIKKQPLSCPRGIRRFFVSPQESGELCLMASIMGEAGDIFYPKLDEKKDMISFEKIALDLLNNLNLEPEVCNSEDEAKQKALSLTSESKKYPIYFFGSDTSGEKSFEEFYTEDELLDNDTYINLGVIKNSKKRSISEINEIFNNLNRIFLKKSVTKTEIVEVLKEYMPNFDHIETGKGLDSKM